MYPLRLLTPLLLSTYSSECTPFSVSLPIHSINPFISHTHPLIQPLYLFIHPYPSPHPLPIPIHSPVSIPSFVYTPLPASLARMHSLTSLPSNPFASILFGLRLVPCSSSQPLQGGGDKVPDVRSMPCKPTGQPGADDSDINTLTKPPCAGVEEAGRALQSALLWTESTFCSLAQESVELKHSNVAPPWEKLLLKAFLKHIQAPLALPMLLEVCLAAA